VPIVTGRFDRLACATGNFLNTLAAIAGKGADFRSLSDRARATIRGITLGCRSNYPVARSTGAPRSAGR
jgi:hypothetical protein